jgi:peptidyl-prolyl cis-trans isomerase D
MGMTADQYAQALRNQLTTQQLINAVVGTDFMLKGETDELAALVAQQRVVREATIDVNALAAKQQVSDADINAWYEQNKNTFVSPEQFRVSYIKLDAAALQETRLTRKSSLTTISIRISSLSRSVTATA